LKRKREENVPLEEVQVVGVEEISSPGKDTDFQTGIKTVSKLDVKKPQKKKGGIVSFLLCL
jgi:hypothetical protein